MSHKDEGLAEHLVCGARLHSQQELELLTTEIERKREERKL